MRLLSGVKRRNMAARQLMPFLVFHFSTNAKKGFVFLWEYTMLSASFG